MSKVKFYKCRYCGNIIEKHYIGRGIMKCCGVEIEELIPNTVDASGEKHMPVVELKDNLVKVSVGSVAHPMVDNHWIEWICLETDKGSYVKYLNPNDVPEVQFLLGEERPVAVFAYCNLHGLWKKKL